MESSEGKIHQVLWKWFMPKVWFHSKSCNMFHLLIPISYMLHVKKQGNMRGKRESREEGFREIEMERDRV